MDLCNVNKCVKCYVDETRICLMLLINFCFLYDILEILKNCLWQDGMMFDLH
jgi:hypothetical protein